MKPYAGTKIDEVAALRLLLPDNVANPYRILAQVYRQFAPRGIFNEARYVSLLPLLYNEAMSDLDTYVSIQDLLHTVFRAAYVDTNLNCRRDEDDVGRYMYSPKLAFHLKTVLGEERKNQNASAEETKIEAEEDSDSAAETPLTEHEVE